MVTTEPAARDLLVGAVFGVGGAWVSILERAQRLTLKPFEPPSYFAFQGATRIILGAVFGVFIVIVLKAGLVLTILHDTSVVPLKFDAEFLAVQDREGAMDAYQDVDRIVLRVFGTAH